MDTDICENRISLSPTTHFYIFTLIYRLYIADKWRDIYDGDEKFVYILRRHQILSIKAVRFDNFSTSLFFDVARFASI